MNGILLTVIAIFSVESFAFPSGHFLHGTLTQQNRRNGYRYYRLVMDSATSAGNLNLHELQFQWGGGWQTNAMTSNSTGTIGGIPVTASASSVLPGGYDAFYAFNGNIGGAGYATDSGTYNSSYPYDDVSGPSEWIKIDFGGNPKSITGMRFTEYSPYGPDGFYLQGSNNDSTWNTISGSAHSTATLGIFGFTWGPGSSVPPNPTGVSGTGISSSQISVSWTSGGGTTTDFKVAYAQGAIPPPDCGTPFIVTSATSPTVIGSLSSSTQYSFRVCALDGDSVHSTGVTGTATTTAAPTITVTSFSTPQTFNVGSVQSVTWTSTGVGAGVVIWSSIDGGSNWVQVKNYTSNSGSFSWLVDTSGTTSGQIKVSDYDNGAVFGVNTSNFTVRTPTLTLNYPNGGESFTEFTPIALTWTANNIDGNINVAYSVNGGSSYSFSVATVAASTGTVNLNIPAGITTNAKFRVRIVNGINNNDASDSPFSITAGASPHILFRTSAYWDGNLGGLSGADGKCASEATAGGLTGTFRALISTTTVDAKNRVTITGPVYNMIGQTVANDSADLWDGTLINMPNFTGDGSAPTFGVIYTGTLQDGTKDGSAYCSDWTANTGTTSMGQPSGSSTWMQMIAGWSCSGGSGLYCLRE